jgi:NAD(P)H-dependent FMN reductase
MRVLCLAGSPARESRTLVLVRHVADLLAARGFEAELVNLAVAGLPHTDPEVYWGRAPHPDPAAERFIAAVTQADAVVLGTPVQHASYSALLKGALDLLQYDAFERRAVGLVANAGGTRGSTIACEHLRSVVKALGGWTVPTQVTTTASDFDERCAQLTATGLLRRCEEMAEQILAFSRAFRGAASLRDASGGQRPGEIAGATAAQGTLSWLPA